jgi:hypothetical protein
MHLDIRELKKEKRKLLTRLYFRPEIAEVGRQAQLDRVVISTVCPESCFIDPFTKLADTSVLSVRQCKDTNEICRLVSYRWDIL